MSAPTPRRSRGLSLVELVVASAIGVAALLIVGEVVSTSERAQLLIAARDRASSKSGEIVADVRAAGFASRRLFQDDADGRAYLAALSTGDLPVMADTRLPLPDETGRLEPDAPGDPHTGNALLLACEDRPVDVGTASGPRRLDVVRFFAIYPTRRPGRVVEGMADRIDLVRFASRPYADRASLDAVGGPAEIHDAVIALRAAGVDYAWSSGVPIHQAFCELRADGTVSPTPVASPVIDTLPEVPARPVLGGHRVTVAPNDPSLRVPVYAEIDPSLPAFPSGFEVKVVGPSGGRQVLVRLVLLAGVVNGPDAVAKTQRLFSVRDL